MSSPKYIRKFLGEVKFNPELTKVENRQNQKELDSYLKGLEKYTYGYEQVKDPVTGQMFSRPKEYNVRFELTKI